MNENAPAKHGSPPESCDAGDMLPLNPLSHRGTLPESLQTTRFIRFATLALGSVFFLSAYLKAIRPADAITALGALYGEGNSATAPTMYGLIAVEIVVGAALLANLAPRLMLRLTFILLFVFTGWIAWLLMIGWTEGCGCGSWTPQLDPATALWISIGRNVLLMTLAGTAFRAARVHGAAQETRSHSHGNPLFERATAHHFES